MEAVLSGAGERQLQDLRLAQGIAYVQAALFRSSGKMPAFDKVFPDPRAAKRNAKPMTPQQTFAAMKDWTAAINGKRG
jgi:hypothetical protein